MAGGSSSHSTRGIDIDSTKDSRWNGVNMQSDFLGLILVAQGAITREDLFAGLRRQTQSGEMLGQALIGLGVLSEDALADAVAVQVGAPLFDADWLVEWSYPSFHARSPEDLDIKILHCAEGVEIWGVRTPSGRIWLEERASSFEGRLESMCCLIACGRWYQRDQKMRSKNQCRLKRTTGLCRCTPLSRGFTKQLI